MYQKKKIISTPISNNRLNWDERTNHTIVVPSLIEGTLDDVMTGEETVIESDVDGKIISGKGLRHFVFLGDAKVPTWIMDNHNHAFAFWHEAFWKGYIQKGSLLVHIDQHTDLATPEQMFPVILGRTNASEAAGVKIRGSRTNTTRSGQNKEFDNGLDTRVKPEYDGDIFLEEIEEYTNSVLTIADFIIPALATGLISEAVMVTGEDRNGAGVFVWENEKLIKKSSVLPQPSSLFPSVIVDIDLDYFSQGFDEAKTLETTKYWIEKADIITIATSPLFIDQEKALEYLRKLF